MVKLSGRQFKKQKYTEKQLMKMLPSGFKFHRKPFKHQLESLAFALQHEGFGAYLLMGLGKTKVAIDYARAKKLKKIIVLTINAAVENWAEEFRANAGNEYNIVVAQGTVANKSDLAKSCNCNDKPTVFIINYDAIFKRGVKKKNIKGAKDLIIEGVNCDWDLLICDESRLLMNHKALRTLAATAIAIRAKHRVNLTGTPIVKTATEIFSQQLILDYGEQFGQSYTGFVNEYFDFLPTRFGYELKPKKNALKLIRNKMYKQAIRFTKEECLDLPKKIFMKRYVDLEGDQKKVYNELKQTRMLDVKVTKKNKMKIRAVMMKFMQICGGFIRVDEENAVRLKSNPKLKLLIEMLQNELIEEKVVVVSSFKPEQRMLVQELNKAGIKTIAVLGGMKEGEAFSNNKRFQEDENIRCVVVSPRVGGRALNFTSASYMIFFSSDFDFELHLQTRDRIDRIGQTKNPTYIYLLARNTVDEKIIEKMYIDQQLIDTVVDGKKISSLV